MKKGIAVLAVLLLAVPSMAAEWSFFGSARVATFYVDTDYGDFPVNGQDDDWGLIWDFQTNSRFGARVKADKVNGYIELALKGTDGGDLDVATRRAYGEWKFADDARLKVGKDYSPVSSLISNQVFANDDIMWGSGVFYGRRPGMLALKFGGFEIAAITNPLASPGAPTITPAGSDPDWNLPKIEAQYQLKFSSFEIRPFAGVNYFKVSEGASILTDDLTIWSYVLGLESTVNIGAFSVSVQGTYGQNWGNANWANSRVTAAASSAASLDGTDDVNDATSWMLALIPGFKLSDTIKFEVGAGYRSDDPDTPGSDADEMWLLYGQAVITMAPGVYLTPEVGYYDLMDNAAGANEGYQWYAGAKWQINF